MKKTFLLLPLAGLALFGFGCQSSQQISPPATQPPTPIATTTVGQPPSTQPTTTQPVINWKTYTDTIQGFSFQYPQPASSTDWSPAASPLDLSMYPTHEGNTRSLTLVTTSTTSARTGCGAYVGQNGGEMASGTPQMINGVPFCEYDYMDGAAGHTGSYFDYVTTIGNEQVVMSFLDFHVTDPRIYADCESGTSTEPKCQPFDPKIDAQIFREIIATFKTVQPVGYVFTTAKIENVHKDYEIHVSYPVMASTTNTTLQDKFNALARTLADDQVTQFNTDYVNNIDPKNPQLYPGTLDFNGVVKYQKPGEFISAFYVGNLFTNGAHPNSLYSTLLFDAKANKRLGLMDVLRNTSDLKTIATMARVRLVKLDTQQMFSDTQWLNGGTDPNQPQNFQFFYFTSLGVTFVFPPYQIAPYSAGPQQVSFTYDDLKDLIKPRFLP